MTPWVLAASVGNEEYDDTSILKTIIARFLTARPPDIGLRVPLSKDVGSLLSLASPRAAIRPRRIDYQPLPASMRWRSPPPEEDFRAFVSSMRARLRGDRTPVSAVL